MHQNRRLFRYHIIGLNVHCLKSAPAVLNRCASRAGNRNSPIALIRDVVGVGITVAHAPLRGRWWRAELNGAQVKLQVFALRSMMSGAAFHRAYHHATQQALFEAHEHAFHYFGGVFRLLRYDNLKSAVKKILRGQQLCQAANGRRSRARRRLARG